MLAKLVLLRHGGFKREKTAIQSDSGVLCDWSCHAQQRRGEAPVLWSWALAPGTVKQVAKPLKYVTLKQASSRGIVLVGIEVDVDTNRPGSSYRQAWWIRPLPPKADAMPTPAITLLPDFQKVMQQLEVESQ